MQPKNTCNDRHEYDSDGCCHGNCHDGHEEYSLMAICGSDGVDYISKDVMMEMTKFRFRVICTDILYNRIQKQLCLFVCLFVDRVMRTNSPTLIV
jgi:hypothetical protein